MKIGIIGAGRMVCSLTERLVRNGHEVMLSNSRGPDSLQILATNLECQAGTPDEAAAFGDIVAPAIPLRALEGIPAQPLAGKSLIDLINYDPRRDGAMPDLDTGRTTTSELVARHLPTSRVHTIQQETGLNKNLFILCGLLIRAVNSHQSQILRRDS